MERGHYVRYPDKDNAYATVNRAYTYYRFHINSLPDFKKYMRDNLMTENLVEWGPTPEFTSVPTPYQVKEGYTPRGQQQEYIDYFAKKEPACKLLPLRTGGGKALKNDTPVKVPGGWKAIGNLEVGDMVTAVDGTPSRVLGVYPQGVQQLYEIVFKDERSLKCTADHLWTVTYDGNTATVTTGELIERLAQGDTEVSVPLCLAEDGPDVKFHDAPYLVGMDGRYSSLRQEYAGGAMWQRYELLQGFLDYHSYVHEESATIHYSTTTEVLATMVQYLARSVGGIAHLTHEEGTYRVSIWHPNPKLLLKNSGQRWKVSNRRYVVPMSQLGIASITAVETGEATCIEIDHPSKLFVAKDFIVTHNTLVSLFACSKIGKRIGVVVQSKYIEKWIGDLLKTYDIEESRIARIEGSASLMTLFERARTNTLDVDVIVFSLTTLQRWFDLYESLGDQMLEQGYAYTPENWFQGLGIGIRLIDEVHQHYRAIFMLDLYSHVEYSMCLSATLISKDVFLNKMYDLQYPPNDRCKTEAVKRYTKAYAIHFNFNKPDKIRTTEFGSTMYSHNAVESSILKHVGTTENYLRLVDEILQMSYFSHRKEKKRAVVFCASIAMCTRMTNFFMSKYPHLDIRRYVGEDPYENAIEPDIRFTTIGSMGAAIDIPDLVSCILTSAVSSVQANIQVLGRLREIPGEDVNFCFFTADNIKKQVDYYQEKKAILRDRAASMQDTFIGYFI